MAKASPYVFEAGNARWTPPQEQPNMGDALSLPQPCESATRIIGAATQEISERVMLHDRSHAEIVAQARRNMQQWGTGVTVAEWTLCACLLFALFTLGWLATVYWRRGKRQPSD